VNAWAARRSSTTARRFERLTTSNGMGAAGVPWFTSDEYTRSLTRSAKIARHRDHNRVLAREQNLDRGLRALGCMSTPCPATLPACDQGKVCGYCATAALLAPKQSSTKNWLADAHSMALRFVVETRALRVRIEADSATGVEARSKQGHRVSVRCKTVISACGSLHTPALFLPFRAPQRTHWQPLHLIPFERLRRF